MTATTKIYIICYLLSSSGSGPGGTGPGPGETLVNFKTPCAVL